MLRLLTNNDREGVMEYISRNAMETSFLYANVLEFGIENDRYKRRCADYYGFFDDGKLMGILPFYNLGSCIPHYECSDAIQYFVEKMKESRFSYLMGMERLLSPLYEMYKEHREAAEYEKSSYFINNDFKPYDSEGLVFKDVNWENEKTVDFIKFASVDGFDSDRTREDIIKSLKERAEEEDFILAFKGGKIVAQANIQTYTDKLNQIGGVYTSRDERGKGYCKAIVSELCRRIAARGKVPTLFVIKGNIPAVEAYKAIGFDHFDDYLFIKFE